MEIRVTKNGAALALSVEGRIDTTTAPQLEAELKKRACTVRSTLLLTVDAAGKVYLVRREDVR